MTFSAGCLLGVDEPLGVRTCVPFAVGGTSTASLSGFSETFGGSDGSLDTELVISYGSDVFSNLTMLIGNVNSK
jgi:hypothetical protein